MNSSTVCVYCGSQNDQDEHRCGLCGRRLSIVSASVPVSAGQAGELMLERTLGVKSSPSRSVSASPESRRSAFSQNSHHSSLARQPQIFEVPAPEPKPEGTGAIESEQGVLFTAHEVRGGEQFRSKVVSFEDFRQPAQRARRRPVGRAPPPTDLESQQTLFSELGDTVTPAVVSPAIESGLYGAARVAPVVQRATAVFLDFAMVSLAEGLMLAALYFSPAAGVINAKTLPILAVLGLFLAFGYKLMFALAATDSPGTRWSHLKILNFDGASPTRNERLVRLAGGLLSTAAAGMGLIWALVDQETLSWHDHISKTFASPYFGPPRKSGARQ